VAGDRSRLDACLTDALLSYWLADAARGRRYLERALRLAEPERLRLPFAMDRSWILPALRSCPDLIATYRCLLQSGPAPRHGSPGPPGHQQPAGPGPVLLE
jgi:LuxR family transcriptional regulator, maltose regulon positive regulatory protein